MKLCFYLLILLMLTLLATTPADEKALCTARLAPHLGKSLNILVLYCPLIACTQNVRSVPASASRGVRWVEPEEVGSAAR